MPIEKISPIVPIYQLNNDRRPMNPDHQQQQKNKKQNDKDNFKDKLENEINKLDVKI